MSRLEHLQTISEQCGLPDSFIPVALLDVAVFGRRALEEHTNMYPTLDGNRPLEFLGDRVLKTIHGRWVFCDLLEGKITDIGGVMSSLEMNKTFICYLRDMGDICKHVVDTDSKKCADIYESIVGAMYYYHHYIVGTTDALDVIEQWLELHTPSRRHREHMWNKKCGESKHCSFCHLSSI
jgi:dsRNA-specific ribonuclease